MKFKRTGWILMFGTKTTVMLMFDKYANQVIHGKDLGPYLFQISIQPSKGKGTVQEILSKKLLHWFEVSCCHWCSSLFVCTENCQHPHIGKESPKSPHCRKACLKMVTDALPLIINFRPEDRSIHNIINLDEVDISRR